MPSQTTTPQHPQSGPRKSDRFIPWYFVGGFAIMLIANVSLITFSMTSWNGLVTNHAFEEGNNYNAAMSGAQRQAELGWRSKLSVEGLINQSATVTVLFRDRDSKPITGAKMEIVLTRANRDDLDQTLNLAEIAPGEYRASASFPVYGRWQIRTVARAFDENYQTVETVLVKP
ncbi:FixH family protein [Thalassospira alkalitolerans]|uniref:Integral membrane protein linked to a cation pump n=1 Tax=Thalassospira alkalitolerans TaxID=1293890 RepID=A0A1Y2L9K3_9PROT|nr:FixH family protein [Thalassospira alkalitolerans]OSQ47119.1 integral membrane protein linked to a cation pump [Thalassospira alkalitolerans]